MCKKWFFVLTCLLMGMMACSLPFADPPPTAAMLTDTPTTPGADQQQPSITPSSTASLTPTPTSTVEQPVMADKIIEKQIAEEKFNPKYLLDIKYPALVDVPRAAVFNCVRDRPLC